jgi:molybdopterin synthase sulfur carrier subunit
MSQSPNIAVHVPHPLRRYCGGAKELSVSAGSLGGVLTEFERLYPDLYSGVCDETGAVRRHVNLFVNTSHFRDLDGLETPLAPGDVVMILPAVSGG